MKTSISQDLVYPDSQVGYPNTSISNIQSNHYQTINLPFGAFVDVLKNDSILFSFHHYLTVKGGKNDFLLQPGNFLFLNKNQKLNVTSTFGVETEFIIIAIEPLFKQQFFQERLNETDRKMLICDKDTTNCVTFFDSTYQLSDILFQELNVWNENKYTFNHSTNELTIKILTAILVQLRSFYSVIESLPPVKLSTKIDLFKRLMLAKDYIDANIEEKLNLDEVASSACLSQFHFLRIFKAAFHITPHKYIISRKLERANYLLFHSKLNFKQICTAVGFESASSFGRLFKNAFGNSPIRLKLLS
jgi:AraC-like DNA-binding protein